MAGRAEQPIPGIHHASTRAELASLLRQLRRREARQREGAELTYRQLAVKAGWSHAMVAAYLTGRTLPPTDRFDTLVRLLGATPAEQRALAAVRDQVAESERAGAAAPISGAAVPTSGAAVPTSSAAAPTASAAGPTSSAAALSSSAAAPISSAAAPSSSAAAPSSSAAAPSSGGSVPATGGATAAGGATAPDLPVPRQLPRSASGFTGRAAELATLDRLRRTAGLVAITGTAGVGKTALAVHWAHRRRDRFPGGQLYLDLRGYAPGAPLRPAEALGRLLRALGVPPEQVPAGEAEAAGLYRDRLAGRRVLVVLDNARGVGQVRPLLPADPGCLALVTSRDRLDGLVALDGAHRIILPVLAPAEARSLLAWTVGADRVAAEPAAVSELTQACAYLPLALRIASANLATRPVPLTSYVEQLRTGDRLTGLAVTGDGQSAVRTAFSLSYTALPPGARRLFRLLGVVPGADLTAGSAAAVAGTTPAAAARLLDQLAVAHLLRETAPGRFAGHDLLRHYAAELAAAELSAAERGAATERLHHWYLATVEDASQLLYPEKLQLLTTVPAGAAERPVPPEQPVPPERFGDPGQALAWLEEERHNLVLAVQQAAAAGPRPMAWRLADALRGYFHARPHLAEWAAVCQAGLTAAQADDDLPGQAAMLLGLADHHHRQHQYEPAIEHYSGAARLSERAGWPVGQAVATTHLAAMYGETGRLAEAVEHFTRALAAHRRTGSLAGQAASLGNLGVTCFELGRLAEAEGYFQQALELDGRLGSGIGRCQTLNNLGEVYLTTGQPDRAVTCLDQALAGFRQVGDAPGEIQSLSLLADAHRRAGDLPRSLEYARTALTAAEAALAGDPHGRDALVRWSAALARNALGAAHLASGDAGRAIGQHEQALTLVRDCGNPYPEAYTHLALATAHRGAGPAARAAGHAREALAIARDRGYRLLETLAARELAAGT